MMRDDGEPEGAARVPEPSTEPLPGVRRLVAAIAALRGTLPADGGGPEDGCAWYQSQTHASLVPYLVEECYELIDAIERGEDAGHGAAAGDTLREELGDVLYQVVFHADIARASGEGFGFDEVAATLADKLVDRNPHVFGAHPTRDLDEIERMWEERKQRTKPERRGVLDGVAKGMPALALADKVLGRGQAVLGPHVPATEAAPAADSEQAAGDALMRIVAANRAAGIDSERALRGAIRRYADRVRAAERGEDIA